MSSKSYAKLNVNLIYNLKNKIKELKERFDIEKTISEISSYFVNPEDIDKAINKAITDIGILANASRSYLFLFREDNKTMDNTHEWCAKGVSPQIKNLQNIETKSTPWWMKKLQNNEIIHIEDVSKLPKEAKAEKKILHAQDIKSLLVLPLHINNNLAGFIGFDNVSKTGKWEKEDLGPLRTVSEIIGNTFERKKAEEKIKESEEKYRTLLENLPQKIFLKDKNSVYISCNKNYAKDLKIKPEEIAGKTDFEFYPKKLAQKYGTDDKRIMKSGKIKDIEEDYIVDGKIFYVHTIKVPVNIDKKGNVTGILGKFWDITDKKKAEEKNIKQKEKYEKQIKELKNKLKQLKKKCN
jgi:PAS domain S-box-containing protein